MKKMVIASLLIMLTISGIKATRPGFVDGFYKTQACKYWASGSINDAAHVFNRYYTTILSNLNTAAEIDQFIFLITKDKEAIDESVAFCDEDITPKFNAILDQQLRNADTKKRTLIKARKQRLSTVSRELKEAAVTPRTRPDFTFVTTTPRTRRPSSPTTRAARSPSPRAGAGRTLSPKTPAPRRWKESAVYPFSDEELKADELRAQGKATSHDVKMLTEYARWRANQRARYAKANSL